MIDIRVKVTGNATGNVSVTTETKASVVEERVAEELGKVLYAVESMGFQFDTDDIYQKAIVAFDDNPQNNRYSVIYKSNTEDLTIEVATRKSL
jgi:hypothetical protein